MKRKIEYGIIGLDYRSIGAFRIALSLLLIWNLLFYKISNFKTIYAPETGLFGNFYLQNIEIPSSLWSPLNVITSNEYFVVVLLVYLILALLLLIGKGGKLTVLLIIFLQWSFNQRYFPVFFGWDFYILVLLFIALLLPINNKFSWGRKEGSNNGSYFNHPLVLLVLIQIACIYFFNGVNKFGHAWSNGTAVSLILNDAMLSKTFAKSLAENEMFSYLFSYATLIFEYGFILLVFPLFNARIRIVLIIAMLTFHWGISIFADVGHFKFCSLLVAILLLPSKFWEILGYKKSYNEKFIDFKNYRMHSAFVAIACLFLINQNVFDSVQFKHKYWNIEKKNVMQRVSQFFYLDSPEKTFISNQSWTLFAPSPNNQIGLLDIEFVSPSDTLSILSNGNPPIDRMVNKQSSNNLLNKYFAVQRSKIRSKNNSSAKFIDLIINNWINLNRTKANDYQLVEVVYYDFVNEQVVRNVYASSSLEK